MEIERIPPAEFRRLYNADELDQTMIQRINNDLATYSCFLASGRHLKSPVDLSSRPNTHNAAGTPHEHKKSDVLKTKNRKTPAENWEHRNVPKNGTCKSNSEGARHRHSATLCGGNARSSAAPARARVFKSSYHVEQQQQPQHSTNIMAALNKLNVSNYNTILAQLLASTLPPESAKVILQKSFHEHPYINMYVRLIVDLHLHEDALTQLFADYLPSMSDTINFVSTDCVASVPVLVPVAVPVSVSVTTYDTFCYNNKLRTRALGVNLVAVAFLKLGYKIGPIDNLKTYFDSILLEMPLNPCSVDMLSQFFAEIVRDTLLHSALLSVVRNKHSGKLATLDNKTRFAMEALLARRTTSGKDERARNARSTPSDSNKRQTTDIRRLMCSSFRSMAIAVHKNVEAGRSVGQQEKRGVV